MTQLLEFAGNHWPLVLALFMIIGLLAQSFLMGDKGSVAPLEATGLINHQDALVLDVRPAADFAKGHIINAVNLPLNSFAKQIGSLDKQRHRPIIVSCRSGSQSHQACLQLRKQGFNQVHNLRGGLLAWQNANLPLTRKGR